MISLEIDRLALATFGFEIFASAIFSLGRIFLRVVNEDDIVNNGDFYVPKTFEIFLNVPLYYLSRVEFSDFFLLKCTKWYIIRLTWLHIF